MDALEQPESAKVDRPMPRRRRGWLQFRLRTLLIVVALCALATFAFRTVLDALPYRQQRRAVALIERLGGTYRTAEASTWHRRLFGGDLQNLVLVDLADSDSPDEYIEAVAGLPELKTLVLGGEALEDRHLGPLHGSASLRHLVLDSTSVSDEAVEALRAAQPKLEVHWSERRALAVFKKQELAHLTDRSAPVPEELKDLVGPEHFVTCASACCGRKTRGFDHLRRFRHIERLVLSFAQVSDTELSYVKGLTTLRALVIGDGPTTDAGLANLADLSQLRELNLNGAPIGDAGLAHLRSLTALERLDLSDTKITDAGLVHLTALTRLEHLELDGTHCTKPGIERLQQALPNCRISGVDTR